MFLTSLNNHNRPITAQQELFKGTHKLFTLCNYEP
jgi:hypothetical protein